MIDERDLRDMLERRARTISATPTDAPKAARRARRRLLRNGAVGVLAGVVVIFGALAGAKTIQSAPTPADRSVQPPPIEDVEDRAPIEGLEFPLVPEGARPSSPVTGDAVVAFRSWQSAEFPVEMAIYADGRVIWHPDRDDVGYFQLRLTPAGVDAIRSAIISTGLFDHDQDLVRTGALSRLTIVRSERSVFVQWAPASWFGNGDTPEATPSESRDLDEIGRLLSDPSAWQLSGDLYADPDISAFVPSAFMFDYDRGEPDLSRLPSPARDLLTRWDPGSRKCNLVTSDVAREIAQALAQAGYAPLSNTHVFLDWKLPGFPSGPSNPHLNAVLPHDVNCDPSG